MGRIVVIVSPGASRSEIVGRHGNAWKARVAAPAERGRANDALVELLGAALGLPPRDVVVIAGASGRRKLVEAAGLRVEEIERRLSTATSR